MSKYSADYYRVQSIASRHSSDVVAPLVVELVNPKSVVDVGCGVGTWLASFKAAGASDVFGVDGSYVDRSQLQIDATCFESRDLSLPLHLGRRFDLVVSLEVAEHLPEEVAAQFVSSLVALGPIVLFSAAIPYQGGTGHLNEQWPEYWANLFAVHGYLPVDCLRRRVWNNPQVAWHYAQNMLLFVHRSAIEGSASLAEAHRQTAVEQLALVHPRKLLSQCDPNYLSLKLTARWLGSIALALPTIAKAIYLRRRTRRISMAAGNPT